MRKTHDDQALQDETTMLDDTTTTGASRACEPDAVPKRMTKRETRALQGVKLVFLLVVFISVVAIAISVFMSISASEEEEFRTHYRDYSRKVIDSIGEGLDHSLGVMDAFAHDLEAYARLSKQKWPFVTVPGFAERAAQVLALSSTFHLSFSPLVTHPEREMWEHEYTVANEQQWIEEAVKRQNATEFKHLPIHSANYKSAKQNRGIYALHEQIAVDATNVEIIEEEFDEFGTPGPYLPMWQSFPVIPSNHNANLDSLQMVFGIAARHMLSQGDRVVITSPQMLPDMNNPAQVQAMKWFAEWLAQFLPEGETADEPVSSILFPILPKTRMTPEELSRRSSSAYQASGVVSFFFYWRDLLRNILHDGGRGVDVVFYNTCSDPFTYRILGEEVQYLGAGDRHDRKYDTLYSEDEHSLPFETHMNRLKHYTGLPFDVSYCPIHVRVFASDVLHDDHVTSRNAIYTIAIVLIFTITSAVFFIYDMFVERRQRVVVYSALESATSANMLEHQVRRRTVKLEDKNRQLAAANRKVVKASELQLQHFACMSHEIRTPLNCIIGCSSLLQDSELDPMQHESLQMINASGDLLLSVVNDVLDFSRLESGEVDIDVQRTSIQNALDSVVFSMRAKAELQNVTLQTDYALEVPEFMDTDIRRMQQILYNLLGNAVKFSKSGGEVGLTVSICDAEKNDPNDTSYSPPRPEADAPLLSPSKRSLRFDIKDYGKGMVRTEFAKIFKPFQQENAETEKKYGGTGLGLAITTKLVHRMGGKISVDSQVGEWCRFTVELPLAEHRLVKPVKVAKELAGTSTIVLVTQQMACQAYVSSVIRGCGLPLDCFGTMQEAKEKGPSQPASTIIYLVQEDLFHQSTWDKKTENKTISNILLTFGPHACVSDVNGHFRTLVDTLPQVFVRNLAEHAKVAAVNRSTSSVSSADVGSSTNDSSTDKTLAVPYADLRVLVAEDNLVNQKVMNRILKRLGVGEVVIVDNGKKAVDKEAAEHFDIILLDMQMPVMDGIEACRTIQARTEPSPTLAKIAFVTAHALNQFEEQCYSAGATEFLTKPCNVKSVDACFQRLMHKAAL